jgi:hypothetical protein
MATMMGKVVGLVTDLQWFSIQPPLYMKRDLQGDPVDCNPPIWLQFCSMAVDPPLTF